MGRVAIGKRLFISCSGKERGASLCPKGKCLRVYFQNGAVSATMGSMSSFFNFLPMQESLGLCSVAFLAFSRGSLHCLVGFIEIVGLVEV